MFTLIYYDIHVCLGILSIVYPIPWKVLCIDKGNCFSISIYDKINKEQCYNAVIHMHNRSQIPSKYMMGTNIFIASQRSVALVTS